MKITIPPQSGTSITEPIDDFELGDYTILAGENNSGKTSIISAIRSSSKDKLNIVYIPAEENNPADKETKSSSSTTPFYKAVDAIVDPVFKTNMFQKLVDGFNESDKKQEFVKSVNDILKDLGVDKKEFNVKLSKEDLKKDAIVKLVKALCKDFYDTKVDEVDLENVGMGTQRMIVTALIRYYEESNMADDKDTLIIIEEPEIYLHPRWKKSLHTSLSNLATKKDVRVLISTHDPYFITLSQEQTTIYHVYRDPAKRDATAVKKMEESPLLDYKSDAEINYLIFDIPSEAYLIELYEKLYSMFEDRGRICESCGKPVVCECGKAASGPTSKEFANWVLSQKVEVVTTKDKQEPKVSDTRRALSHGRRGSVSDMEIRTGIKELTALIKLRHNETKE